MTVDVLSKLAANEMSLEEVETEYDRMMDASIDLDPREALGLSNAEWTAFAQGVWFDELAAWRKSGWPAVCAECAYSIDVNAFGWLARGRGERHELIHIECPSSA